ncbi:MAG TPA: ADP-ribosylglycohydrolase family protein [Phycisphaerae bacterium]|nr:ADP-ribosylglycohydrolase family protein [Phycisphaerae bacterium]
MRANRLALLSGLCLIVMLAGCGRQLGTVRLSKEAYIDKCKGAWAGQMIGVCYGEPYQFQYNGQIVPAPLREWKPELVEGAIRQDDVYVELTFLAALEAHGLDITPEQAGLAFAATPYPLWHANLYGRLNIRNGIMPPLSGHPKYNRHADDIDFQIEADLLGIICPGLPHESNRLCDIFGHIMNHGDGVYGGMFMAGMYTEAYFESDDVVKVIRAGMACIPKESSYYQCIDDTLRWCRQYPDDWTEVWRRVEEKYNDDVDCIPGNPHNIDARINGAYTVIGLMYGGGDLLKTIEVCTRCGQDADSSTANAGGIIGCMKGYNALDPRLTSGIPAIADQKFLGTDYSFNTLVPACLRVTEAIVRRTGGEVIDDALLIARQSPRAPETLESWPDKREMVRAPVTQHEIDLWNSQFKRVEIQSKFDGGFYPREYGRTNVLQIMPITPAQPVAIEARMQVPDSSKPSLKLELASDTQHGDYRVKVFVNDRLVGDTVVRTDDGEFAIHRFELGDVAAGSTATIRIEFHANDWAVNSAFIRNVVME